MGSSFYIGMPSAMAMLYCHQLLLVLRIAALYGREPAHAARAAMRRAFSLGLIQRSAAVTCTPNSLAKKIELIALPVSSRLVTTGSVGEP